MLVRVPDYYERFRCLAGDCPHSCCEKWMVVIDEETVRRYKEVPGALGDKLRTALRQDEEGDFCFPLNGGRCPFLDQENLCEIHKELGQAATSVTCREHPRFTEDYGPFREITLSASCPAANDLLLGSDAPLAFREFETEEPGEEGDVWLEFLLPLRERLLDLLADRAIPLRTRLLYFLQLAAEAQWLLEEEREAELPALAGTWMPPTEKPTGAGTTELSLIQETLRYLGTLEVLESDWRELLKRAGNLVADGRISGRVEGPEREAALERIAGYFAFRYLLKCVNDGDLLSRAQFVVLAVLVVERLAAVCGLPEGLRRFSCEIEHNDDNLDALTAAMWQEETLSLTRMLTELAE